MPKCTVDRIDFGRLGRRIIEADFSGGELSSDGGLLLLRQVDRHLGLSAAAARAIPDPRDPERIRHGLRDLLAQRLYALCCGYEDLNDHKALREDVLMQTALGRDEALASAPTFSRLENRATRAQAWALHGVLLDQFVASYEQPPEELVLDIDASDVPLHGNQELSQFHGYYDHHCYLPLYVFCGQAMLACYLRPSQIDAAMHAAAVIKLIVRRLRTRATSCGRTRGFAGAGCCSGASARAWAMSSAWRATRGCTRQWSWSRRRWPTPMRARAPSSVSSASSAMPPRAGVVSGA